MGGGVWDTNVTANWYDIGSLPALVPAVYIDGMTVLVNDNASNPAVVLNTTVNPRGVTVNNNTLAYTVSGSGKITGTIGLVKQGTAPLAFLNTGGNDYTGPTLIADGTLTVKSLANGGSPSAIGAATASPANLVLNNGTLNYAGPAAVINRGYALQGTNDTIQAQGNLGLSGSVTSMAGASFTKSGAAQLAYTGLGLNALAGATYAVREGSVVFDGSAGAQSNTVAGTFSVGGVADAVATLTNTTLTVTDDGIGNVPGSFGSMTVNTGSTLTVNSWLTLGDSANSVSALTINGGVLNVPNGRFFLCSAPGTTATLNINGGVINKTGDYYAIVNGGWNGNGARTGVVNQVNGTVNSASECWVGDSGGAGNGVSATYNLSGGTLTVNNWFGVGRDCDGGVFHMSGGILNKGLGGDMVIGRGASGVGIFILSGGTINKDTVNPLIVGQGGGRGEFDQSGGTLNTTG